MKTIKTSLRVWIALTSVLSFFVGWVSLAHSLKPYQASDATQLPALQPLDFGGSASSSGGFQLFAPARSRASIYPMFRTGGS